MSEEDFCSVEEFLEKFKGKLQIPDYQRGYAWSAEQVGLLVEDVRSAEMGTYFLGTVILHDDGKGVLDIVDGQQRVRTLVALLGMNEGKVVEVKVTDSGAGPAEIVAEAIGRASEEVRERLLACRVAYVTVENLAEAFQLFDTQNGRGKPLSVENLLKAFHYNAMTLGRVRKPSLERLADLERCWEEEVADERSGKRVEGLLTTLLFLARRGCRGEGKAWFDRQWNLGEFQGVTLGVDEEVPAHGVGGLCHAVRSALSGEGWFMHRFARERLGNGMSADCDPFTQVGQLIVNGEDFFVYAGTYARLARRLFPKDEGKEPAKRSEVLRAFHAFYRKNCLYGQSGRTGDRYARAVYEALILLLVDRFGEAGLQAHHEALWRLAYHERFSNRRLCFERAGQEYFVRACQALVAAPTLPAFGRALRTLAKEQRQTVGTGGLAPFGEGEALNKFMMGVDKA